MGTVASEVYSFGATLSALLTGHAPYERPGEKNDRRALAARALGRGRPAPVQRPDAPEALLEAVRACLQQRPERRPGSIFEVVALLQLAEEQAGLRPTPLELPRRDPGPAPAQPEGLLSLPGTSTGRLDQLAGAAAVGASAGGTRTGEPGARGVEASVGSGRRRRVSAAGAAALDDATRLRPGDEAGTRKPVRRWPWGAAAAVACAALAVCAVVAWHPWGHSAPVVDELEAVAEPGGVVFSWASPQEGATAYEVRVEGSPSVRQVETSYRVQTPEALTRVCATVSVVTDDGVGPASPPRCARSAPGQP